MHIQCGCNNIILIFIRDDCKRRLFISTNHNGWFVRRVAFTSGLLRTLRWSIPSLRVGRSEWLAINCFLHPSFSAMTHGILSIVPQGKAGKGLLQSRLKSEPGGMMDKSGWTEPPDAWWNLPTDMGIVKRMFGLKGRTCPLREYTGTDSSGKFEDDVIVKISYEALWFRWVVQDMGSW